MPDCVFFLGFGPVLFILGNPNSFSLSHSLISLFLSATPGFLYFFSSLHVH